MRQLNFNMKKLWSKTFAVLINELNRRPVHKCVGSGEQEVIGQKIVRKV